MSPLSNAVVGDGYRSTFGWDLLEDLTEIGIRMAGQEGEDVVADAEMVTPDGRDGHPSIRSLVNDTYEIITF